MAAAEPLILVPLDGSDLAQHALPLAARVAERLPARLLLFSVPQPSGLEFAWCADAAVPMAEIQAAVPVDELSAEAERIARTHLETQAGTLRESGIDVACSLGTGEPAAAIARKAAERGVFLVVMATHGRGGVSRWALGSVADKVLRRAPCPLLLVRSGMGRTGELPRRILVPLDGSRAAEAVLPVATRMAAAGGAEIILSHVIPDLRRLSWGQRGERGAALEASYRSWLESYLDDVAERLGREAVAVRTEPLSGADVAEALLARQSAGDIDLLALTTHGRGGLDRWAFGSVADRLVRAGSTPVLVARVQPPGDGEAALDRP